MSRNRLVAVLLFTTACHSSPPNRPTTRGVATTPSLVAPATPKAPSAAAPAARLTLAERLAQEVAARPDSAPPTEVIEAALARAGLQIAQWRQVLASTVGAAYCRAGHTPRGVAVALCQYPDEASAARGLTYSHGTFDRLIPNRELRLNRTTLLTLAPPAGTASSPAVASDMRRAADSFARL